MSYFNFFEEDGNNEWQIQNDATNEMIEQYGIPVYYLPRSAVEEDTLFGEDRLASFDEVIECRMYLEDNTVFGGQGDLFSNFGLEVTDTMKLMIQQDHIIELLNGDIPEIGDLIQFKFNKDIFQINFVEDESQFYISGAQTTYSLSVQKFIYSGEDISTGDLDIDKITDETLKMEDDSDRTDYNDVLDFTETNPFGENF